MQPKFIQQQIGELNLTVPSMSQINNFLARDFRPKELRKVSLTLTDLIKWANENQPSDPPSSPISSSSASLMKETELKRTASTHETKRKKQS